MVCSLCSFGKIEVPSNECAACFVKTVHCITYSIIPARHRILWVNCVDLVWNAILATKAQKDQPHDSQCDTALLDGSIRESAVAIEGPIDPLVAIAAPAELSSVKQTKDGMSAMECKNESNPPIVQEVHLTGTHIEIRNDGIPVLVGGDNNDTQIPISNSGSEDSGNPSS